MAANGRQKHCLPPPRSKEERDHARRLYEAGEGYRAVSEAIGVPISTLRVWSKRDRWQKPHSQAAIVPQSDRDPIPDTLDECAREYEANLAASAVIVSRRIAEMDADDAIRQSDKLKSFDGVARRALKIESEKPRVVIDIGILANSPAKRAQRALYSAVRPDSEPIEILTLGAPSEAESD